MRSNRAAPRGRSTVCGSAPDVIQYPTLQSNFCECDEINGSLTELQRLRNVRVNLCSPQKHGARTRAKGVEGAEMKDQAIDREDTMTIWSSAPRRPCEALSNWRIRTAGTGRLNR